MRNHFMEPSTQVVSSLPRSCARISSFSSSNSSPFAVVCGVGLGSSKYSCTPASSLPFHTIGVSGAFAMRNIVRSFPKARSCRRCRRVRGRRPWSFPLQRFSKIDRKITVLVSIVQAFVRSIFSGATCTSSIRNSKRQIISSRCEEVAIFGGIIKRTSIGVPFFGERLIVRNLGPLLAKLLAGAVFLSSAGLASLAFTLVGSISSVSLR